MPEITCENPEFRGRVPGTFLIPCVIHVTDKGVSIEPRPQRDGVVGTDGKAGRLTFEADAPRAG